MPLFRCNLKKKLNQFLLYEFQNRHTLTLKLLTYIMHFLLDYCGETQVDIRGGSSYNLTIFKDVNGEPTCIWIIESGPEKIIQITVIQYLFNILYTPWPRRDPDTFLLGYGNDSLNFTSIVWQNKENAILQNIAIDGSLAWLKFDNAGHSNSDFFFIVSEEEPGKLKNKVLVPFSKLWRHSLR